MTHVVLPQHERSFWIESAPKTTYPALAADLSVDVAVIGGGIAGICAAYAIAEAGKTVAVVEQHRLGGAVTGKTTGKVTSQHNLIYTKLYQQRGAEFARRYGEANQAALEHIAETIERHRIDCSWRRENAYVFARNQKEAAAVEKEARIAQQLGLPAAFIESTALPFSTFGAVQFADQATFHPLEYLHGLASVLKKSGNYVFEQTRATHIYEGTPCRVTTRGGTITARKIIVATNVPFPLNAHTFYGAYEYPLKSYIIAARYNAILPGMYITPGGPIRSILPVHHNGDDLLLIGGESHFPGLGLAKPRHQKLADYAAMHFGVSEIAYRWSTWDYLSADNVPLVGPLYPWSRHLLVATGFMKWGLTTAMAAGMVLRDAVLGVPNSWANIYTTRRWAPIKAIPKAIGKIIITR